MSGNEKPAGDTRKCPYCAEWIKAEAILCRYCGQDVAPTVISDAEPPTPTQSKTAEETSTSKRKPWLIWVIVGVLVGVGAIITALLMRSPDGSGGSGVPELDAVADTWEQASPQLRDSVCRLKKQDEVYKAMTILVDKTIEVSGAFPRDDVVTRMDLSNAALWFLNYSGDYSREEERLLDPQDLPLIRGFYLSSQKIAEVGESALLEETRQKPYAAKTEYLGPLDNYPDPCADGDTAG